LAPYGDKARSHPDGIIDLSVGTPVDDTPQFIQDALVTSANSPRYPVTVGTPELRAAMRDWAINVLGVQGEFDVLPTIGSKELVALLPTILQSKKVLYPTVAYPTYLVGAEIAGAQSEPVDLDASRWPTADLVWVNSPSNPTGQVQNQSQLQAAIDYARRTGAIIASDECYLNFPAGDVQPISILKVAAGNNTGLIAVHSLSKRSNLAGYRAGIIVGDPKIIATILEVRKHSGLMVPLPVQRAQEALADVYERWGKVKKHENPEAYVMRVMVSKHADMRRKWLRKAQEKETSWDLAENIRNIADHSDDVAQRLLVQSALKSLTAMQRAVIVLSYEHGFVLREIAEILEIPMGTAASHLARGKAAVLAHLDLVPEFEKSVRKTLASPQTFLSEGSAEIVYGEVVDE